MDLRFVIPILICCFLGHAQFVPYFKNFDVSQYNAGNQNWDISEADDGRLYLANNDGLLEYDGLNWKLHTIPNKTTLRAVLAQEGRIYVGSYEEFGYFSKNGLGEMVYESLVGNYQNTVNEEIWQIISHKGAIVFRSFRNIYIYKNNEISKLDLISTVISCDVVGEDLLVSTLHKGIFKIIDNTLVPLTSDIKILGSKVVSIVNNQGKLLISTALNGFFTYDGKKLEVWETPVSKIIKKQQLNSFSKSENGEMVLGTIQDGIYITDEFGNIKYHIHRENGLINNTILSQFLGKNNKLWVGLDNGISFIDLSSSITFFNDVSGKLGAVYDVALHKNRIYIGSNTGLYVLNSKNKIEFIEGSQGQVWDLSIIEGDLICGHNNGTYLVDNDDFEPISMQTGGWVIKKVPERSKEYIQGTYAGLVKFSYLNGKWMSKHLGKTTIPIRFLAFENSRTAWAAHAYKGLYKIRFNESADSIIEVENYEDKGLESLYNLKVYNIKNDICIKSNEGWQKYEPILDSIVPHDILNQTYGEDFNIISDEGVDALVLKKEDIISIRSNYGENKNLALESEHIRERFILGYEKVSRLNEDLLALNLNDGFMVINKNEAQLTNDLYKPEIESIKINGKPIYFREGETIEIPNNYKDFTISLSSPKSYNYHFEYAIVNRDSSTWYKIEDGNLQLSGLGYGDYKLKIRTNRNVGNASKSMNLFIEVLPPWYNSQRGYLLYLFLALLTTGVFYYLHKRKIVKEQNLLVQEYNERQKKLLRQKTIENEKRIFELKNESLENEIDLKSKQLANTAMALVKKNETLLELKDELITHKSAFDNYYAYKKLIKKIDGSIGHDDEWDIFENNFNQVHQEFFNGLNSKHPNLTSKDLKVCAYIKMGLSTKEIAPLINISIRGVETQRYRLKQKLNLDSDNTVTDYLRNFK